MWVCNSRGEERGGGQFEQPIYFLVWATRETADVGYEDERMGREGVCD